jgi:TolB protein
MQFRFIQQLIFTSFLFLHLMGCQSESTDTESTGEERVIYSTFTDAHGWQIWQLGLKSGQTQQLTSSPSEAYYPSWGPNGELAYADHSGQIWVLKPNSGSKKQRAEPISKLPKHCGHPAISPDGKYLICVCFNFFNRSEDSDLYLVNLETSASDRFMSLPGIQKHPAWSPDAKQLVFSSGYREFGEKIVEQLWIMAMDNKIPVKIVDNGHSNINPAWSPDGKSIAYSSDKNGSMDIWLYNVQNKKSLPLTTHSAMDTDPLWRSDGSALIFLSTRDGPLGLWEINLASKKEKKLLLLKEDIHEPVWQGG